MSGSHNQVDQAPAEPHLGGIPAAERGTKEAGPASSFTPDPRHQLPESEALNHLWEYPLVKDTTEYAFEKLFIGRISKNVVSWGFETFGRPLVPIIYNRPVSYAIPVVKKIDGLSEAVLARIDKAVPAVQKPAAQLYSDALAIPSNMYKSMKSRYAEVYVHELGKFGEANCGMYTRAKVGASTGCLLGSEALVSVSEWITEQTQTAEEAEQKETKDNGDDLKSEETLQERTQDTTQTSSQSGENVAKPANA